MILESFDFFFKTIVPLKKRRGVSQVIGSLLMLAIVVPLGTVILFNGTSEINAFNNELANSLEYRNNGVQEDLVFEHIRFDPTSKQVMISLRNSGTVETTIDKISIVNMTNQKLVYKITDLSSFAPIKIPLKITLCASVIFISSNILPNYRSSNEERKCFLSILA